MINILKEGDSYTVTLHAVGMTISVDNQCLKLEAKFSCCEFFFMHVNKHANLLNTLLLCLDTYSCVARLDGHSSRNLGKPLIIHRRRNKQVSCLCSS